MNRQFGALSGLAILLIVLNHSIQMGIDSMLEMGYPPVTGFGDLILTVFQGLGVFAVPIFLFISGSFVAYAAKGEPPQISRKFLSSSLKHILWPYLIWSILFYILVYFQFEERYSLLGYVKNLIVGYPYHFVPLLVLFYLLSPLLVRFQGIYVWIMVGIIFVFQLFLLNAVFPGIFGFQNPSWARILVPPVFGTTMAYWGIYFPLGLAFGLNASRMRPSLSRLRWIFLIMTIIIFVIGLLNAYSVLSVPLARVIVPIPFILTVPVIKRNSIPFVRQLERIGKRSYGIYLTHLIFIDLTLVLLAATFSWLFKFQIVIFSLLFTAGLVFPFILMKAIADTPLKRVYRYVFG